MPSFAQSRQTQAGIESSKKRQLWLNLGRNVWHRGRGWCGRRGFGHALEACKNFLSTAVSGGVGGEGVWARFGGLQELCKRGFGHALEACQNFLSAAVSGGSRPCGGGAVRAVGVVWAEGVWARIGGLYKNFLSTAVRCGVGWG